MALPDWARQDAGDEKFSARGNAVASGISYNLVAAVFQILGSLVSILIMSRLLSADDFGIYGMIMPFVTILLMIADGGTIYYTLRLKEVRDETLSFAFWYTIAIGAALVLALWAAAPAIAWLMSEQRLIAVALVMAVAVFFGATGSQHTALITRCFRNDLRALAIVGSVTGSLILAIGLAWAGFGYWALVGLLSARVILNTIFSALLTGWRPRRVPWDRAQMTEIARLGNAEVVSRILISGVRETDRILIGILFPASIAGYYSLAYMLSIMPLLQLLTPLIFVILPFISEQKDDAEVFFASVRIMLRSFVFVIWSWCVFAALFAEELLSIFVGAELLPAAEIFPILVISAMLTITITFASLPFQAIDRPDITRRLNFQMLYIFAVTLGIAAWIGTPQAVALAVVSGNLVAFLIRLVVLYRHFSRPIAAEIAGLLPVIGFAFVAPVLIWCGNVALPELEAGMHPILHMAIVFLAFAAIHILVGAKFFGDDLRRIMHRKSKQKPE